MSSRDTHHALTDILDAFQALISKENKEMEQKLRERKEAALAKREHHRQLAKQKEQFLKEQERRRAIDRQDLYDLVFTLLGMVLFVFAIVYMFAPLERMGYLHSAITERVQQRVGQLFYKNWFSKLLLRFRQIRDELAGMIFNFWQMLQFQQEPLKGTSVERDQLLGPVDPEMIPTVTKAASEKTLSLCRQVYNLQMENIRVNEAAAADVNRIRDKMETLRRDNAENLKNVCQLYGARVGGKTRKIRF
ncbi:unnamed protein product [Caenorhabditis brenneri]